ncbi:transmembrane amino acid transporter protein-domain-containing protein [Penicillium manginii]|uniref:transmembrane amino acid transporter protein-domain-containing protein n=1 Tax=Penicillium manginii TaxID=203109 RepID=UPI0025492935|nr:transmembrane amino acid transporter protein-domain-containing protein [Penicillium manginii]KAJ5742907.1 transmembrane amino acid transporter protein-domain-containing protein [Penicillium manginii]
MALPVQGRTAIVTGAGSGINLAFAKLLLQNGCNVLIADLGLRPEAQVLVEKYQAGPVRAIFQKTDVTDWPQLERMFEVAEKEFNEIDIVCPGAGVYEPHWSNFWRPPGSPPSKDSGGRYALVDINITHPIRTTQLAIAHFLRHRENGRPKHIVHISSIAGQNSAFAAPIYVATKHAINGLVRSLGKLERLGIRVTAVAPGVIKTPLWTDHPEKLKMVLDSSDEWVTPEEVGEVMLALVQQEQVSEVIGDRSGKGKQFTVSGGNIYEVSKTVRLVNAFNDEGPGNRPGNTASDHATVEEESFGLLAQPGWGRSKLDDLFLTMEADVGVGPSGSSQSGLRRRPNRGKRETGIAGDASWSSSVINLVNTIIGAGQASVSIYNRDALNTSTAEAPLFFALSQLTYPNAAVVFDAAIAIKCFGVGVSYLIIIGDLMPGVVNGIVGGDPAFDFLVDRHFWVTAFMLIVIPLSYLRRLDSLKYTSIAALVSMAYLVVLVVYHFIKGDTMADRGPIRVIHWAGPVPTLSSFPVIVFAFTCHQNMFSILNEIKNNSHFRTTSVVFASIGGAAGTYILVAITGYLSFGNNVAGNIVGMYPPGVAATIARAAIVMLVVFSYPLQCHPCRASVDAVLKWRPKSVPRSAEGSPHRHPLLGPRGTRTVEPMSDLRFSVITTTILIMSYLVAMTVSSLEAVLAYVGSTGSTSISFILPGLFYYKISSPDSPAHRGLLKDDEAADDLSDEETPDDEGEGSLNQSLTDSGFLPRPARHWRKTILRRLSLALALYGVVVMVVCFITNTFFIASP